jgi:DNA-binding beta-propeller fold protein YncE
MISTDMMHPHLYLTNIDTNKRIRIDLSRDKDHPWPGGLPLHTIITPDGRKAYLSVMNTNDKPLTILALRIGNIDWKNGTADVKITKIMHAGDSGIKPSMLVPTGTDAQPVTAIWKPDNHQLHGPTAHPSWKFVYFTDWTDNKIRVVDVATDKLAGVDPIQDGTLTRQLHGVFFNPTGTLALAPGYYYDMNQVILFKVDEQTGNLTVDKVIPLTVSEEKKEYAAFTQFVTWLDKRYAITSSQQTGNTSLTPTGWKVIGPSVWLIDAVKGKAKMIIDPVRSPDDEHGIYKPASDVAVVGERLYVGEEDSMDRTIDNAGYISVWNITDISHPRFMKRLRPGGREGLPAHFQLAHTLYRTLDGRYVYVEDWNGGHVVKIDTRRDDKVVDVASKSNVGWHMPHGAFIPGAIR